MTEHRAPEPDNARRKGVLPWILLAVFVAALGVVLVPRFIGGDGKSEAAAAAEPISDSSADPLFTAINKCDPSGGKYAVISADTKKLTIRGANAKGKNGLDEKGLACVVDTTGMPGAIASWMKRTTKADGQLQTSWPGFNVVWTNDPDKDGLILRMDRVAS
jgi:hypothetical protein